MGPPWPIEADGFGNTLELINPELDNSIPYNWRSSLHFGTPGLKNSKFIVGDIESNTALPSKFELFQNFPNPFNPSTTINYSIPQLLSESFQNVQLKIYDILGREISELVNQKQLPGNYEVVFDASSLSSGIYFYKLQTSNFIEIKKMIVLK